MKRYFLAALILTSMSIDGISQIHFSVAGTVSPEVNPKQAGILVNRSQPHEEFEFNLEKMDLQYAAGLHAKIFLSEPFFMEASLKYTKQVSTFHIEFTMIDAEHPVSNHFMEQTRSFIICPVNLGVAFGMLDATTGFRASYALHSTSGLHQLSGFVSSGDPLQFGWQMGLGLNVAKSRIGIEFQSEFRRIGQGMHVNNQSLEINHIPGRFAFSFQQSI